MIRKHNVLFILSPSFLYFPFPPWPVGTLVHNLRKTESNVHFLDLHAKLSLFNVTESERRQIQKEVTPQAMFEFTDITRPFQEGWLSNAIRTLLPSVNFDIVAISCALGQPECYSIAVIIGKVCKQTYQAKVIIGGESQQYSMLQRLYHRIYHAKAADWVASGPGEPTLNRLLTSINIEEQLPKTPGLIFHQDNIVRQVSEGEEPQCLSPDFTDIDFQAYEWVPESQIQTESMRKEFLPIRSLPFRFIRGCPFRCSFCKESGNSGVRAAEPQEAVDAISKLVQRHDIRCFHFLHSTLNISREYFTTFCTELQNRIEGVLWSDCVRPDIFDENSAMAARRSGAIKLVFGFETASKRLLKQINKRLHPQQVARALKASHDVGIWTAVEVIVGFPGEIQIDLEETIGFLTFCRQWIDEIWVNRFFLDGRSQMFRNPTHYGIAEVLDRRISMSPNPFDIPYPPIRFRENGRSFEEQEASAEQARQQVVKQSGILEGDAENQSSLHLLFSLGGRIASGDLVRKCLTQGCKC